MARPGVICLLALVLVSLVGCGSGGGGGGNGSTSASRTTFTGNLSGTTAAAASARDTTGIRAALAVVARLLAATHADAADVQVCVEGTTFCTFVDDDGVFTLAADVGGDVTLVFTGPGFTARVTLTDVPVGATVRLTNISCSTVTGICVPEDLEIEGLDTRGAIRCEQGPIHIVHAGELVIDGGGDDCIRTEGQCEVTIQADRLVLQHCDTCVRTAGGSDVTLDVGAGGFECHAAEDGIRSAGNSAVHVTAGGDVDIDAGEVGVLSEGTALVEIAGDQCRIAGDEHALDSNGNADIVTSGCASVDLVGGTGGGDDDQGDDDGNDDDDHGNGKDNGKGHD